VDYPFTVSSASEDETKKIASDFASLLNGGEVIVLNGNLGSGKTFFIKHALKKLGMNNVNSPTFAIVNEYQGKLKAYHFDFYRISFPSELFEIGFNDYLNDTDSIIFIEWGNFFPEILPPKRIEINITIKEDFNREFYFQKYD